MNTFGVRISSRRINGNNERTETGNECSNNLKSQPEFLSLSHRLGPSIRPNAHKDRQKQLEALQKAIIVKKEKVSWT